MVILDDGGLGAASCVQDPPLLGAVSEGGDMGQPWVVVDTTGVAYGELGSSSEGYVRCQWTQGPVEGILDVDFHQCPITWEFYAITETEVLSLDGEPHGGCYTF